MFVFLIENMLHFYTFVNELPNDAFFYLLVANYSFFFLLMNHDLSLEHFEFVLHL